MDSNCLAKNLKLKTLKNVLIYIRTTIKNVFLKDS